MQYHSQQAGFSLIELLVSMTIFSVVMTMAAGTLLVLLDANAKAQNKQQILNNLTFAVDSMSREIRTGKNYVCSENSISSSSELEEVEDDCNDGGIYLSFVEAGDSLTATDERIAYAFDEDWYGSGHGAIIRRLADGDWVPMTARNTIITFAEFVVTGAEPDDEQPTVTIFIQGEAGDLAEVEVDFAIQTSVTQRQLD